MGGYCPQQKLVILQSMLLPLEEAALAMQSALLETMCRMFYKHQNDASAFIARQLSLV